MDAKTLYNVRQDLVFSYQCQLNFDSACQFLYLCRQNEGIFINMANYIAQNLRWTLEPEICDILENIELHEVPPFWMPQITYARYKRGTLEQCGEYFMKSLENIQKMSTTLFWLDLTQ